MKRLKNLKKLTAVILVMIAFTSCSNDDDNTTVQPRNVVQTAQSVNDLSILVDAVVQAGLVDALSASGQRTVLAPTNAAFTKFLDDNGFDSLSEVPDDVLKQILLNHVIDGSNIPASVLIDNTGYVNTLADGPNNTKLSLYYNGNDGVIFNGGAEVTTANVSTINGIVHIIDEVIALPTIATFATSNDALSILVDALKYADTGSPTVDYIDTVSDADLGPFTVFAPSNTAFAALLTELKISALTDLDTDLVDNVLLHHIISGNVISTQLTDGDATTLGGPITVDATEFTLTDSRDRESNIVTTLVNIQGVNGVVHVIDRVLLPPTEE